MRIDHLFQHSFSAFTASTEPTQSHMAHESDFWSRPLRPVWINTASLTTEPPATYRMGAQRHRVNTARPSPETLNYFENMALRDLRSCGLTAEMLLIRNSNGHDFESNHLSALRSLINRGISIQPALAEIEGLSKNQAYGIEKGLTREDIIRLENFWHISTLERLKAHGLTSDMLLNFNTNGGAFDDHHRSALCTLVEKGFTIRLALAEIEGLSGYQAEGIHKGLTREDVIRLNNYYHVETLAEFKTRGLTLDMLLTLDTNNDEFDSSHQFALRRLVNDEDFTIWEAVAEIRGLSARQVHRIEEGATRQQILNEQAVRISVRRAATPF